MARIPDEQIERLKSEVSLVRLVEQAGVILKKQGKDYVGRCPFHDDRTPSLVVSPSKNLWHCLGACQMGGDVIEWTMKARGVSFRHAVELLRDGAFAGEVEAPVKRSTVTHLAAPLAADAEDATLLLQVIDYYHQALKQSPEALAYLDKRGLNDPELIEHFKLGVADRTLSYRLPEKNRKAGAELRGRLQSLGLLRASGHEHFNGSLVIPVIEDGRVCEVYGRKLRDNLRKGTAYHLYLPGPHAGVFNAAGLAASPEVILCESLIDALTFWRAGYRNVTASYGVEGFTHAHLAAFEHAGIERVLIAYDRDEAGDRAANALAERLRAAGLDAYRIQFPKGMDANGYAGQVQPAAKSLGVTIRSAVWLGQGQAPQKPTTASSTAAPSGPAAPAVDEGGESPSSAAESSPTEAAPLPALPAAVIPEGPAAGPGAEVTAQGVFIERGDRRYRVRGLDQNLSINQLKVNLRVSRGEALHVDTFDLYTAKSRGLFIKQAAVELGVEEAVLNKDLARVLLELEALQEARIEETLNGSQAQGPALDDAARAEALALLQTPDLMTRIAADFERCGVVGEAVNAQVGYLACVSRLLDRPLAVIVQSTSAAGKSALMDAVLSLMPEEERVQYSAMTGQSLFYLGETELKHRILAISEEEGAATASYALKLLQSEGVLTIASTAKDETTGNLVTRQYRVEGPVMLFLTTTAIDIDEELMNRCLVLTVNETREQTRAIHAAQRRQQTLAGLLANEERKRLLKLHADAQRLLRPLAVANPFAEQLRFIDDKTRTRRDHLKYLTLIRAIALLHQHQREIKTAPCNGGLLEYIEATRQDIETANALAHEVLGRTLDELPPQTAALLGHIRTMVLEACRRRGMEQPDYRFSRRDIREATGWSDGQLKIHCARLTELEYLLVHRGGRGQRLVYELLYDGELEGGRHLMGLIDPASLRCDADPSGPAVDPSGLEGDRTAPGQGQVTPESGPGQGTENGPEPSADAACGPGDEDVPADRGSPGKTRNASYRSRASSLAAEGGR